MSRVLVGSYSCLTDLHCFRARATYGRCDHFAGRLQRDSPISLDLDVERLKRSVTRRVATQYEVGPLCALSLSPFRVATASGTLPGKPEAGLLVRCWGIGFSGVALILVRYFLR